MKTTNKIQKTALTAALAVGFSIFGFSIEAQVESTLLPENNSANNLAMANVESGNHFFNSTFNSSNSKTVSTFAGYLENETETALNIEGWMLDDSNFSSATSIESEMETPMELETWMTDEKTFNRFSATIETAIDEEMQIEDWMFIDNKFEVKNNQGSGSVLIQTEKYIFINNISFPAEITEKSLRLEDWMINSQIWK